MLHSVVIRTGARLHFGPLSYRPESGRHFGGVGLMIQEPGCKYRVAFNRHGLMLDEAGDAEMKALRRWRETTRREPAPPIQVRTMSAIPSHHGLGSGTQRSLAVGEAASVLSGERDVDVPGLAARMGRGLRSTVGIQGYLRGGLIVDAGHAADNDLGALACRLEFPEEWSILLLSPTSGIENIAGDHEIRKFEQLSPMPAATTGHLCRLALTEILPAIQLRDCGQLNAALADYGRTVGEFFAPVQGGNYRSRAIAEAGESLLREGLAAVQSSWGPTAAVVCPDAATARACADRLQSLFSGAVSCRLTQARNTGRELILERDAS